MEDNSDLRLYFDAAATTCPRREVVEFALSFPWYNPSSIYRPGVETRKEIDRIRKTILNAAGASAGAKELIFTSGGTESNNMAIHSALRYHAYGNKEHGSTGNANKLNRNEPNGNKAVEHKTIEHHVSVGVPKTIWVSGIDHSSVHETVLAYFAHVPFAHEASDNNAFKNKASDRKTSCTVHAGVGIATATSYAAQAASGIAVRELPVDRYGHLCLEEVNLKGAALICLTHVNNEIGTIADVEAVYRKIRELPAQERPLLLIDGVQAFGKISPAEVKKAVEYSDFYSISAHKIHGLKGVGALIANKNRLQPFHIGGDQEGGLRGGTENTIGMAAFGRAVELLKKNWNENMLSSAHKAKLRLTELIEEKIGSEDYVLNSPTDSTPFILSVSLRRVKSEVVIHSLAEKGILVSGGSACSSTRNTLSRVIRKIGTEEEFADGTIRISLSPESFYSDSERPLTDADYVFFAEELANIVAEIQKYQKM